MHEWKLDGTMLELLRGVRGRPVESVYANASQVALVYPDATIDIQPGCRRVSPDRTDELCFAAVRYTSGNAEELPRGAPSATRLTLSGVWLVQTMLCFVRADRAGGWRRLVSRGEAESTREVVCHPDGDEWRECDPEDAHAVDNGVILDFEGLALAAFCPDNSYRFALDDESPFAAVEEIAQRHQRRYRFTEL